MDESSKALNLWQDMASGHEDKPLASAALVDPTAMQDELQYRPDDFFLGKDFRGRLYGVPGRDDTHVLVCGGTRADKGTSISNTLLNRLSSVYFASTKPQDVRKYAPRRGRGNEVCDGMGQKCYCLDSHGIVDCPEVTKVRINVIGGKGGFIDPTKANCVSRAMRLAICLLPLSKGGQEDYFTQDARSLLVCLILYVASAPQFEGRRNIGTVYDLLLAGDVATWEALKERNLLPKNKHGKITQSPHDVLWAGMEDCQECGGVIAKRAAYFAQMASRAGEQFAGVQGGVAAALGFLDDEAMRESLSESTFDFSVLKTDPRGVTFFDILEASKAQGAAPARRMIYAMFEEAMKSIPGSPATGLQTLIWMDEFYAWGYMDSILGNLAELAGHGCKFVFIVQTMAMLESVYSKEGLQIFLSGCLTRIFLDIRDTFTCDLISRMAGEKEVILHNRSASLAHGTTASDTHTDNSSTSTNNSHTEGKNRGTNSSRNVNTGGSKGDTFNGSLFSPITPLFLKKMWNSNSGTNWCRGVTVGEQSGSNISDTTGGGTTAGESDAHTEGENDTETRTIAEQRQVRPLLPVDEIINRYGKLRPDGKSMILVQICGIGFFELERVRYWEHHEFYRKYGHDGDHTFVQAPKPPSVLESERIQAQLDYERSPKGKAEAAKRERQRIVELAALREQEDYSLLARSLTGLSVAAGVAFALIGAVLPAFAMVPAFFAARRWVRLIEGRRLRIQYLESHKPFVVT